MQPIFTGRLRVIYWLFVCNVVLRMGSPVTVVADHFSGPSRAVGPVCLSLCVWTRSSSKFKLTGQSSTSEEETRAQQLLRRPTAVEKQTWIGNWKQIKARRKLMLLRWSVRYTEWEFSIVKLVFEMLQIRRPRKA